jgi:hypothetical protein
MQNENWTDATESIFKQVRERIEFAAEKARQQKLENAVVLVLDLSDDNAMQIALTSGRDARIEEVRDEALSRGVTPIGVWHLPWHGRRRPAGRLSRRRRNGAEDSHSRHVLRGRRGCGRGFALPGGLSLTWAVFVAPPNI